MKPFDADPELYVGTLGGKNGALGLRQAAIPLNAVEVGDQKVSRVCPKIREFYYISRTTMVVNDGLNKVTL